ncbi:Uncharacterized protein SAPIO_CDS2840 [Scedosporium apiospermum]|uniref:DUF974 domain-containing protein n=1 Tax=Pseudallescheria apiosperma TaxID=563466 RepID=A0A084GBN3_PSEDA|nr:Uncharacterized protein SAPIO_CDS2840 [Scedosporium apiospermum]KEZ44745.1 Uncharacterized protein SAPIO_CDS2840 [Scedosporium apiospermum]
MSHQRYPSHDPIKEPHAISLKVLRLSRPSLVVQYPVQPPTATTPTTTTIQPPSSEASLAYTRSDTNPDPFILSPAVSLPLSFGSAFVGETFSCTLCANNDLDAPEAGAGAPLQKHIRDVRIEAEMKTPGASSTVTKLNLLPADDGAVGSSSGVDLEPGETLQKIVSFDLREEGNHVLAVTVSYYEATELSGRTRTFRKLYQFICKSSMIVRTKAGPLRRVGGQGEEGKGGGPRSRRWVLEAQLENCSEDVIQLENVLLDLRDGLEYSDCNWEMGGVPRPVLHPSEVEQICFVVREKEGASVADEADGRTVFGTLSIGWRGEMGNRGFLKTGQLGSRSLRQSR